MSVRWGILSVLALTVVLAAAPMSSVMPSEADCDQTISPESSIQEAIDDAVAGAVLCLRPGTYAEHVKIEKALTLRGLGSSPEAVNIVGTEVGPPVVWVQAKSTIEVNLKNLTIANPKGSACILLGTQVNCPVVVAALGKAQLVLEKLRISSEQPAIGLYAREKAELTVSDVQISKGAFGIFLEGSVEATIEQTSITESELRGVHVQGEAHVRATDLAIQESEFGLAANETSTVEIVNSEIAQNATIGVLASDASSLTLEATQVKDNGADRRCTRPTTLCNGITVQKGAQLVLKEVTITGNADWGLGAVLRRCGAPFDDFQGQATFEGENTIADNNTSGNERGRGNPGDHPFTDSADGQVCLP